MGVLKLDGTDAALMREAQGAIVQAVLPFKQRTEAALVVFALIRCARTMLRLYPKKTQLELLAAIIPFLEGKPNMPGDGPFDFLSLQ